MNLTLLIQYATSYYLRISILHPLVLNSCKLKWPLPSLFTHKDILSVATATKTVLIGTLYKEMCKKPCILKNINGCLGSRKVRNYCSEGDLCILEDNSARIRVKGGFNSGMAVTGAVVGVMGIADQ